VAGSPQRILIVDDNVRVAALLKDFLKSHDAGYVVITVPNATEALEAAERHRPDLVILDLELPDIHGLQVLQRLRALDRTIPVIVLSGTADLALAARTLSDGAVAYAPKPLNLHDLDNLIALHLPPAAVKS
jgi:DNA-binding response OmpR family regulator